jgi:hypothetical protein
MSDPYRRSRDARRGDDEIAATRLDMSDAVLAELRALRCDLRELIAITRREVPQVPGERVRIEKQELPPMMTIAEAGELLRTSPRALYMRIRRGGMPGVVRIGSRRLMVKTDEFLRELHRMPTFE